MFRKKKDVPQKRRLLSIDRPSLTEFFFCFQVFDRVFFCAKLPTFMGVFFLLLVTFLFERSAINDALVTSILRSVDPADVVSLSLSLFFSLDFFVPLHFSFFLCLFFLRRSVIWSHHRRERERKREAPTDGIECVAIKECAILKRSKRSAAAKKKHKNGTPIERRSKNASSSFYSKRIEASDSTIVSFFVFLAFQKIWPESLADASWATPIDGGVAAPSS